MFNGQYTTGTITITSGSPNFTTSGAALQSADIRPGDVVVHNGLALVIASITGQNAGTFTANAPAGAAGAGVPLRIIMQNDGSRLSARQAALIALLSGGNTQALAGLTGAANTGLHFTGAGAMATHDLTAFGRAVAGLTGANGSFIRATGANTAVAQSILGTVSQSSGVPTGAIIQRGSNANGEFVRFADGTQICWGEYPAPNLTTDTAFGSLFRNADSLQFTFPAAFVSPPQCSTRAIRGASIVWIAQGLGSVSNTGISGLYIMSTGSSAAGRPAYIAIGGWF